MLYGKNQSYYIEVWQLIKLLFSNTNKDLFCFLFVLLCTRKFYTDSNGLVKNIDKARNKLMSINIGMFK